MEKQTNDYDLVKHTLAFISENWREQPSLETLADQAGLSPTHLQRLFTRWAGLSPKAFLQAVTAGCSGIRPPFWTHPMSSGFQDQGACMISL